MPIFRAIGLVLIVIVFQLFVPRVFKSVEDTVVATFNTAQVLMSFSRETIINKKIPLMPGDN